MWAKLHLLNKTLQFSRWFQSYWCGNSLKNLWAASVGDAAQTLLWDGKTKVKLLQAWPPSPACRPCRTAGPPTAEAGRAWG